MKNYDGRFCSTYTNQLPFGEDIVCGAYDEGYDWSMNLYFKKYKGDYKKYREDWIDGKGTDDAPMSPMNRVEFREYVEGMEEFPSHETWVFIEALRNGSPRPYDGKGREDKYGLFDTSALADDVLNAVMDGAYDGYIDAVEECSDVLGIGVKRED